MGQTQRQRRVESLQRRLRYIEGRLEDEPDGAAMFERQERRALRYVIGIVQAARRLNMIDALELDAHLAGEIPYRDVSGREGEKEVTDDEAREALAGRIAALDPEGVAYLFGLTGGLLAGHLQMTEAELYAEFARRAEVTA